jgi:rubrerythrin
MKDEQAKTLRGIRDAIRMEVEGKEFYTKLKEESTNKTGKDLFECLAEEEDKHRQRFESIYRAIQEKKGWPDVKLRPAGKIKLRKVFVGAVGPVSAGSKKAEKGELGAVAKAMDLENKTLCYYKKQAEKAVCEAEEQFYRELVAEERGHYLALVDYREYIIDPAAWYQKAERHSLDGA